MGPFLKNLLTRWWLALAAPKPPTPAPAPLPIVSATRLPVLQSKPPTPLRRSDRKPLTAPDEAARLEMLRTAYRVRLVLGRYPHSDGGAKASRWKPSDHPVASQLGLEPPYRYFATFGSLRTAWCLAEELAESLPLSS